MNDWSNVTWSRCRLGVSLGKSADGICSGRYAGATFFPFLIMEGSTQSSGPREQMSSVGGFAPSTCVSGGFGFGGIVIQVS